MEWVLPTAVTRIIRILHEEGYPAYVVGGSVRDYLRGLQPHDWDICTAAPVERIVEIFKEKGYGIAPTGMNFGTVTVLDKRTPYEITVFRKKADFLNPQPKERRSEPYEVLLSERPLFNGLSSDRLSLENTVNPLADFSDLRAESLASLAQISNPRGRFRPMPHIPYDDPRADSPLYEDLGLRDFTINAIAYSPQEGFIDPYGGRQDIEDGILRCPGLAEDRLREDPLRILRALRFAADFGFAIHYDLGETIHRMYASVGKVAVERITGELLRFMDASGVRIATLLREYVDVFCYIMPELRPMVGFDQRNHNHVYDVWEHTLKVMEACKVKDRVLKFAILFHDTGKPHVFNVDDRGVGHFYGHAIVSCQIARQVAERLRLEKNMTHEISALVEVHDARVEGNTRSLRNWINRIGLEQFKRLLVIKRCDSAGQNPYYWPSREEYIHSLELAFDEVMTQENTCYSLQTLAVNGRDVMKLGYREAGIGRCLKRLLNEVLNERLPNDRKILLRQAEIWKKEEEE